MKCLILECETIENIAKKVIGVETELVYSEDKSDYLMLSKEGDLIEIDVLYKTLNEMYGVSIQAKKLTCETSILLYDNDSDIIDGYIFIIK